MGLSIRNKVQCLAIIVICPIVSCMGANKGCVGQDTHLLPTARCRNERK